jgi:hypothetical protein
VITAQDARASIEDVQLVRRELADRADCSLAWRITTAALIGTMFAAQAARGVIALALTVGSFAAIVVMAAIARKRMGFFINGYRKGRTRSVAIALLFIFEAIFLTGIWVKIALNVVWAPIVGGAIIVPIVLFAMSRWHDAYRSEFAAPTTLVYERP